MCQRHASGAEQDSLKPRATKIAACASTEAEGSACSVDSRRDPRCIRWRAFARNGNLWMGFYSSGRHKQGVHPTKPQDSCDRNSRKPNQAHRNPSITCHLVQKLESGCRNTVILSVSPRHGREVTDSKATRSTTAHRPPCPPLRRARAAQRPRASCPCPHSHALPFPTSINPFA